MKMREEAMGKNGGAIKGEEVGKGIGWKKMRKHVCH
jgi:hypothetical protein